MLSPMHAVLPASDDGRGPAAARAPQSERAVRGRREELGPETGLDVAPQKLLGARRAAGRYRRGDQALPLVVLAAGPLPAVADQPRRSVLREVLGCCREPVGCLHSSAADHVRGRGRFTGRWLTVSGPARYALSSERRPDLGSQQAITAQWADRQEEDSHTQGLTVCNCRGAVC